MSSSAVLPSPIAPHNVSSSSSVASNPVNVLSKLSTDLPFDAAAKVPLKRLDMVQNWSTEQGVPLKSMMLSQPVYAFKRNAKKSSDKANYPNCMWFA